MPRTPTIRIVRSMARSGGTLIAKCIGCMHKVTLLSEIHPANLSVTNPMMQAQQWFDLVNPKDVARWKIRPPNMLQFVSLCETRASARGDTLILRDWSHLDYIGVPYITPQYGFALSDELDCAYQIKAIATTRHPIDQYLSLLQLPVVASKLKLDAYLLGCRHFAQYAKDNGFYRYEDFTKDPSAILQSICNDLDIQFDPQYVNHWQSYTTITGDTVPKLGRGSSKKTIESFDRKPIANELLEAFLKNKDYQQACELLGYSPG